ncbi:MAG: putative transcriptional regulator protein LacI family [Rhizobium sp.]|nr:putative transcriptional regulator protein LacI family [Rhizobium sp.]
MFFYQEDCVAKRPTIRDLAAAAGVSIATVDRVLNRREPVREETARLVYDAAKTIGYHAVSLLRQRVFEDLPQYRLGFILQRPNQAFYQMLEKEIEAAAKANTQARIVPDIHFVSSTTPTAIVEAMKLLASRNSAVAVVAPDYPAVTVAVEELHDAGIPVFSMLTDIAGGVRRGYIGLNNVRVGRTAAWLIATAVPERQGKVACFVGSYRYHGHELREAGFRSYLREHAPTLEVVETVVNLETPEFTHEATINLLKDHPDLVGFYVSGGGMEGAISAVREEGMAGKLAIVVNELTPDSRSALNDGVVTMVLATPMGALCSDLLSLMVRAVDSTDDPIPGQTFVPFNIFVSENV